MKLFVSAMLLFIGISLSGQPQDSLSLEDCLELALENSKKLKLQKLQLEKQLVGKKASDNTFIPEINAFANYYLYLDDYPVYVFPSEFGTQLEGPMQLGANQNFYTGILLNQTLLDARLFAGKKLNDASQRLTEKKLEMNRNELRYEVITAYYQVKSLEQNEALIAFNRDLLEKLELITQTSVDNEFAQQTDLDEIHFRQEELALQEKKLHQGIIQSTDYLKFLCGPPDDRTFALSALEGVDFQLEIPDLSDSVKGDSWELLELQKELGGTGKSAVNFERYPSLDLYMSFQWLQQEGYGELFTSEAEWFNQHMVGLRLNIPIFGKANFKDRQQTEVDREIFNLQQELLLESNRLQRQKVLQDLEMVRQELANQEKLIDLRQRQYAASEVRHKEAQETLKQMLDAGEELLIEKVHLQQLKIDYMLAIIEVHKAFDMLDQNLEPR